MQALFVILSIIAICIYVFVIGRYIYYWKRIEHAEDTLASEILPPVTVIIPFRNESQHLQPLIDDLSAQIYPEGKLEILLIDDHSSDYEIDVLSLEDHRISILKCPHDRFGKKSALEFGLYNASHDVVLFSDADTRRYDHWVRTMASALKSSGKEMVGGPVYSQQASRDYQQYYDLELAAFAVITGGAIGGDLHAMANGANIILHKSALPTTDPFKASLSASGDDIFLADFFAEKNKLGYCKRPDAIVTTFPPENYQAFISQKLRWASKNKWLEGQHAQIALSTLIAVPVLILLSPLIALFYGTQALWTGVVIFLIKCAIEYALVNQGLKLVDRSTDFYTVVKMQLINFRITLAVIGQQLTGHQVRWKGRNI
ncbi:MAG: glycosyltransferase [Saprospiraceae bacterium]|nr:glycosyltransferase [Saprospiraceae bacterium]